MGRGLRRFTGILLTLSISLSLSAPVMAVDTGFTDVAPNAWYCAYVDYAAEAGLFKGATPTGFEPDRAITRGELITVLGRLYEKTTGNAPAATSEHASFLDVPEDRYYAESISWAGENGLINGYPDGTFRPDAEIDRESMAAMLARYLAFAQVKLTEPVDWFCGRDPDKPAVAVSDYADSSFISDWAVSSVAALGAYRIMVGSVEYVDSQFGDTAELLEFQPQRSVTRAEAAAVMTRIYQAIQYSADEETEFTRIPFDYTGDAEDQTFMLDEAGYQVISDHQAYRALVERMNTFAPDYELPDIKDAAYFTEKNLLAVELQAVGCPIFEVRLTDCTIQDETASVTFLKDAHGSTADVSGFLYLIEIPKSITDAEVNTVGFVHMVTIEAP